MNLRSALGAVSRSRKTYISGGKPPASPTWIVLSPASPPSCSRYATQGPGMADGAAPQVLRALQISNRSLRSRKLHPHVEHGHAGGTRAQVHRRGPARTSCRRRRTDGDQSRVSRPRHGWEGVPPGRGQAALKENPSSCVYCCMETDAPQVDHAIPRSRGGNATLDNAQTTCQWCNASKGARDFPVSPPGYRGLWPPPWWP
jgi:5-methylcytosine-specific restriction endonuclease McrA